MFALFRIPALSIPYMCLPAWVALSALFGPLCPQVYFFCMRPPARVILMSALVGFLCFMCLPGGVMMFARAALKFKKTTGSTSNIDLLFVSHCLGPLLAHFLWGPCFQLQLAMLCSFVFQGASSFRAVHHADRIFWLCCWYGNGGVAILSSFFTGTFGLAHGVVKAPNPICLLCRWEHSLSSTWDGFCLKVRNLGRLSEFPCFGISKTGRLCKPGYGYGVLGKEANSSLHCSGCWNAPRCFCIFAFPSNRIFIPDRFVKNLLLLCFLHNI